MSESQGISGKLADLYNVFMDWKGRLGRELPGLLSWLRAADAHRVLDTGCGTGRHVAALLEEGFEAYGADLSEEMLAQARALVDRPDRFFSWRMGDEPPAALSSIAPFDAIISLGNVWPQLTRRGDVARSLAAFRALLRPGGTVVLGLKAFSVRRETGDPYLPLLRREHQGRVLHFVRFLDFQRQPPDFEVDDDAGICGMHMLVVGDEEGPEATAHHRSGLVRAWGYEDLANVFAAAGFTRVSVSASLADPDAAPSTENVFVHATAPRNPGPCA